MPKSKDRAHYRPKASAKSNSWFRMQASADNEVDIYIYDEIGYWGVAACQSMNDLKVLGDITHISLHISSPGGDVFDGIAIFNALKHHGAAITVCIDGLAASMASAIAMVGNPVIMPENTMMVIRKPWEFAGGDANGMRDYADLPDKVESVLVPAYAEKTGKTTEETAAMLDDETRMDGKECLEHGFVDQVTISLQAMACVQPKCIEDSEEMPNSIRNMITPPRNTTVHESQQLQPQVTVPQLAVSDEATARAQVLAEQKSRVNGINDLSAMFGGKYHELQNKYVADPECTAAQAKDELLVVLGRNVTPSNKTTDTYIYAGDGNLVGDGVRQALMARAGFESIEWDNVYNDMTLCEYARMALTECGIGVPSYNPMQMTGTALTHSTSNLGDILLDVASRALLQGWEEAAETLEQQTKKGQLSDPKTAHRAGLGGFSSLCQVREGAEYKYVTTKDKGENIALATYGEIFSTIRQTIVNDDLNQSTDVPMKVGCAAKGTIGDLVYVVLTENAKLSDGKPLFHADHGNISAGVISVASLNEACKMMRLQKEGERPLNIRPIFMLASVALETLANQTIRPVSARGVDVNAGIMSPIQNFVEAIAEPRPDAKGTSAWYLAAAKGTDTTEVAYLNGVDTPYIDQQEGFATDGIATKARIDAGVPPLDYRGMAKSIGK